VVSEREHREQFEELNLLQTRGFDLCLAIVGPPRLRNRLSEAMRATNLHRTKMAGELATLQAVVSSVVESMLGRLPNETFRMEILAELDAEFWRLE
jgi:hypothetical protein